MRPYLRGAATRRRANARRLAALVAAVLALTAVPTFTSAAAYAAGGARPSAPPARPSSRAAGGACPWVAQAQHHSASPTVLANEVIRRMTLAQKAAFVVLSTYPPLENANTGVPSLCIPALTLTDGPDGVANGLIGVTQFPAALAVAATFDPSVARSVGVAEGAETRTKGIAVVQGPELNLARVAQSGRIFETYGEDPYLTSVLGVADVEGIQSTGELADAKHFTAYTQETARLHLNQKVAARSLAELYDAPFRAVVQQAHVASIMCSYGELNGVNTCSNPSIYATLRSWGFAGFVRSDLGAVANVVPAFRAGLSLVKPGSAAALVRLVQARMISTSDLDRAVRSVLVPMFGHGLITNPVRGSLSAVATTPAHASVALTAATESIVLLKNQGGVLPLQPSTPSIAVIGADASQSPQASGGGSSQVAAPYVVTPLSAIRASFGRGTAVTYEPGGPPTLDLDQLTDVDIVRGVPLKLVKPIAPIGEAGKADIALESDPAVTPAIATATEPGTGHGWDKWNLTLKARVTGTYEIVFQQYGDTWLTLNGKGLIASAGLHAPSDLSATAHFTAGQKYVFSARWFQIKNHAPPKFSLLNASPLIARAVSAARKASVAVVFVGNFESEGVDSPNLQLPGDANALIEAVAAVNPRTVVVLNTGGPVVMPWISKVAGVVEAWYPGQEDGRAIARVLTGAVDPSGRLPVTFPVTTSAMPATADTAFPGVNSTVTFGSGLNVGYRWYQANAVAPLFPFGFGESYTTFSLSGATLRKTSSGVTVRLDVTNTGSRRGVDVVQAYVHYPPGLGEPPEQLRGFQRVDLASHQSRQIVIVIPKTSFEVYANGALTVTPGSYRVDVGQSSANLSIHLATSM
jgi:beta-glucosidase